MIARTMLKIALANELEARGHTLEQLDEALSKCANGGLDKQADGDPSSIIAKLMDMSTMAAAGTGIGLGGAALLADNALTDTDKAVAAKEKQKQEIVRQMQELRRAQEMGA